MSFLYLILYLLLVFFLISIDQYTKSLFVNGFSFKLNEYIRFYLVYNEGSAFGIKLFDNKIYILIGSITCLFFIYLLFSFNKKIFNEKIRNIDSIFIILFNFSILLIISGIIGNLIDRIKYSKVVDWISFLNFPVFNLADSYITIGAIIFVYSFFKLEKI